MAFSRDAKLEDFERAALPFLNDLFRTAARLTGARAEAQDIVQNVYLQAWRSFERFERGTNCRAWLFKILLNEIRHHRRRLSSSKVVPGNGKCLEETAFEAPVPEALTDEEILAALDSLAPEFREVILLADVEEFAYREIADILSMPIGTVMSRLSRARKQLRVKLKGMIRDSQ
jgi:RNA polymerase sigma-70 factor (ECF subfamily)